jgi:hypothetical protein
MGKNKIEKIIQEFMSFGAVSDHKKALFDIQNHLIESGYFEGMHPDYRSTVTGCMYCLHSLLCEVEKVNQ